MLNQGLRGVIAAIITPVDAGGSPDTVRLVARARYLLDNGCDALNLLGTTGEATSFSRAQRIGVMSAVAAAGLPLDRFMVGTGAAAVADAVALAQAAADLGFAAALVLPPFYYKPVSDEGVVEYVAAIAEATAGSTGERALPLYLYNIPAQTGIAYSPVLVARLIERLGSRIAGLKDSSGDLAYAASIVALSPDLRVFPSSEGVLLRARDGEFAGCISATANLNSPDCAAAFHGGDAAALARAVAVRALFDGLPLVPGVKAVSARLTGEAALATLVPPLMPLSQAQSAELWQRFAALPHLQPA